MYKWILAVQTHIVPQSIVLKKITFLVVLTQCYYKDNETKEQNNICINC